MPSVSRLDPEAARRWQSLQAIVDHAVDLPGDARESYLESACEGDEALLDQARRLVLAIESSEHFLERPLITLMSGDGDGVEPGGLQLGAYRLVRRLAVGGMGDVWLAERHDGEFEQRVAIKILSLRVDDDEARARLRAERQILARLEHPNVARLFDGGTAPDGRPYLVMELIDGEPIDLYCARRRLDLDERLRLVLDLCSAVAHAHEHGLVHRDLKPSNVLVTHAGVVKLVDFGIAKALAPAPGAAAPNTLTGRRLMTPGYASPEQIRGETITTATDVHGLGILLYELVTGCRPFAVPRDTATVPLYTLEQAVCEGRVLAPGRAVAERRVVRRIRIDQGERSLQPGDGVAVLRRRLGQGLDAVVMKALAKTPEDRYPSAAELTEALQEAVDRDRDRKLTAERRRRRRQGLRFGASALLAAALLALTGHRERPDPVSDPRASAQQAVPAQIQVLTHIPFTDPVSPETPSPVHVLLDRRLRRALASVPRLRLSGNTSSRNFYNSTAASSAIAYRLGADVVSRGVVKQESGVVSLQAVLEDGVDGRRLTSWQLEGTAEELAQAMDGVASDIAKALAIEPPRRRLPPVPDLDAFAALVLQQPLPATADPAAPRLAVDWLIEARSLYDQANLGHLAGDAGLEQTMVAVRHAIDADPDLAESWVLLADVSIHYSRDLQAAREALARARELDPSNVAAIGLAARLAAYVRDFDRAVLLLEQARDLDPLNPSLHYWLGQVHYFQGDLAAAEHELETARAFAPARNALHSALCKIYLQRGDPARARRLADREPLAVFRNQAIVLAEHALGREAEARQALDQLIAESGHYGAFQIAEIYAFLGDFDAAFEWLDRALDQRDGGALLTLAMPVFQPLRDDPRMDVVRERLGMATGG